MLFLVLIVNRSPHNTPVKYVRKLFYTIKRQPICLSLYDFPTIVQLQETVCFTRTENLTICNQVTHTHTRSHTHTHTFTHIHTHSHTQQTNKQTNKQTHTLTHTGPAQDHWELEGWEEGINMEGRMSMGTCMKEQKRNV